MTQEEKVALLKEAGVWDVIGFPGCIDKLFDLVSAHEREKQAKQEQFVEHAQYDQHGICRMQKFSNRVTEFYGQDGSVIMRLDSSSPVVMDYAAPVSVEAAVLAEREACAKFVDHILKEGGGTYGDAIRARSKLRGEENV